MSDEITVYDVEDSVPGLPANQYVTLLAHTRAVAELREALRDAIECVEHWSSYASLYFQDKHNLVGDLDRLRAALAKAKGESK